MTIAQVISIPMGDAFIWIDLMAGTINITAADGKRVTIQAPPGQATVTIGSDGSERLP